MRQAAENYVGGARVVGLYSLGREQANLSSANSIFNDFEDITRGAHKKDIFY